MTTTTTPGIENPAHLKAWLLASGRRFIILTAEDLCDGVSWPALCDFQAAVLEYSTFRQRKPSGFREPNGGDIHVGDRLSLGEIDACREFLDVMEAAVRAELREKGAG